MGVHWLFRLPGPAGGGGVMKILRGFCAVVPNLSKTRAASQSLVLPSPIPGDGDSPALLRSGELIQPPHQLSVRHPQHLRLRRLSFAANCCAGAILCNPNGSLGARRTVTAPSRKSEVAREDATMESVISALVCERDNYYGR